jgi:hypothetical protein
MTLPYETATSGERALAETQRILAKFGCQSFGHMIDAERGVTVVQFKWQGRLVSLEASWAGYAAALRRSKPNRRRPLGDERLLRQAQVSVCSVLRDWTKAQVTAIECGTLSFEEAFAAHLLLKDGSRLIDHMKAALQLEHRNDPHM